jgi:predicted ATP-grasp superfamily ATP-dependent carboligase
VRDPRRLFGFLAAAGIPHAAARFEMTSGGEADVLIKKVRSAGGSGTRAPVTGEPLPPGHFLQERLRGPIGSAAFLACDRGACLLGITEQLAGWEALGASGFRYAGSIGGPASALLSKEALGRLDRAAQRITERFSLRGLNGLDYVVQDGVPHLIEVNPRWTASMELIEERLGRNLFDLHLRSLDEGWEGPGSRSLALEAEAGDGAGRFLAKGILYATHDCSAPDPAALEALGARDRPRAGESLAAGQPICTLIVQGDRADDCRARLRESADTARALLRPA